MDTVRMWWADSRGKTAVVLVVLWMATLVHMPSANFFARPLLAIVFHVLFDGVLGKIRWGKWFFSLSTIVTGLLIGLIFDPTASVLVLAVACLVASVGKHVVGLGRKKHIFNPAAFGIVTASLLFSRPVAWWASAWGSVPLLIVVVGMTPVLYRLRRLWMPAMFFILYFFTNLLFAPAGNALRLTFDSTAIPFAFVMVPEPLTAVSTGKWRYAWGALVGVLVLVMSALSVSTIDPLLVSLLGANAIGFLFVRKSLH